MSMLSVGPDRENDNRRVALLKSLVTNNRFYVLVTPESGLKNADTVEAFPEGALLGIAYPCLEDGLNDFAIIRSTFETIDQFPDDAELRVELMEIIEDAKEKLRRRLTELRDRILDGTAVFLGTDLNEFREYIINLCTKGVPRKTLDSMMKLDVFESVATTDALLKGDFNPDFMYHYEFLPENSLEQIKDLPPRVFISRVFQDVLSSVENPENYADKHVFDRNVFQKFIALMFVNYATTDSVFYGTNKADYGVSADKEMDQTPLYVAVGQALRAIERARQHDAGAEAATDKESLPEQAAPRPGPGVSRTIELSNLPIADQQVMEHLLPICRTADILLHMENPRSRECGESILRATHRLFVELKEMGIFSSAAESPVAPAYQGD
ncbi:MAG: hypothetical protein QHJ73_06345 [Armatimonadota bacterium]|nr:hypothetical protein [Armatimonadota bacterium]